MTRLLTSRIPLLDLYWRFGLVVTEGVASSPDLQMEAYNHPQAATQLQSIHLIIIIDVLVMVAFALQDGSSCKCSATTT
jgi:hypothetical protein